MCAGRKVPKGYNLGNDEKLLWLHPGHGVKKEDREVVEGRTCKALQVVQMNLDFIQRVAPLSGFKRE